MKKQIITTIVATLCSIALSIGLASTARASDTSLTNTSDIFAFTVKNSANGESVYLDELLSRLNSLPSDLKYGTEQTVPNYKERLLLSLSGLNVPIRTAIKGHIAGSWWGCLLAVGSVIVQYGVPVYKVIKWITEARRFWGGVTSIMTAIRLGVAIPKIGAVGVKVLEGLFGVGNVVDQCFH